MMICNESKKTTKTSPIQLIFRNLRHNVAGIGELQASLKDDTTGNGNLAIHRSIKTP